MKTAIVTGGAKRIGAALSRTLAEDGWHVLVHCNRSGEEAEALASELGHASVVRADLADPDAARTIMAALGGLPPARLLVNNASLFEQDGPEDFAADRWDRQMAVNLRAPALLTQAFAALGTEGDRLVVNLLDAKLAAPNPDFFSYTVSKIGLAGFTDLAARAYAARGVRVCGIAPAVVLRSGDQSQANFEKVHALNPLHRGVTIDDVAAALRFLIASPAVTGQVIMLDAGHRFLGLTRDVQYLEPE